MFGRMDASDMCNVPEELKAIIQTLRPENKALARRLWVVAERVRRDKADLVAIKRRHALHALTVRFLDMDGSAICEARRYNDTVTVNGSAVTSEQLAFMLSGVDTYPVDVEGGMARIHSVNMAISWLFDAKFEEDNRVEIAAEYAMNLSYIRNGGG